MKKEKFDLERTGLFGDMSREEIRQNVINKPGRPKNDELLREGAQNGLPATMTRQTMIVNVEQIETLKNYAYTERRRLKDIVAEAFAEYINNHVDPEKLLIRPDDWR